MKFIDPTAQVFYIPPPPLVYLGICQFTLRLDPTWIFPVYVSWDVQKRVSPDGINYSNWIYVDTVHNSDYLHHRDLDISKHHQFRYKINTKAETSEYSTSVFGGKPKMVTINTSGYAPNSAAANVGPMTIYEVSEI